MASEGLGSITWWGFTPALDLQDEEVCGDLSTSNLAREETSPPEFHILLVGSADLRHVLNTLSLRYKHTERVFHFYILENNLELVSRSMLQMAIALEPQSRLGLQEKTELFLELYGNLLVREQSMAYVVKMSTDFIKMVTDFDYLAKRLPCIDLTALKFKERDFLESVFKIWRDVENRRSFNGPYCWDQRVRKHLGVRYDAVPNVFDWDCSMILHERGANIVHPRQYSRWRHKGVAFELRDANYDVSNRTLSSAHVFLTAAGDRTARLGYWGDIVCSPYIAFGLQSENKDLFKKSNNQYMAGSVQVTEYNVLSMFSQLANQKPYESPPPPVTATNEKRETPATTITEIKEVDEEEEEQEPEEAVKSLGPEEEEAVTSAHSSEIYNFETLPNTHLHFLPTQSFSDLGKKSKYHNRFQLVYFASSMSHLLKTSADFSQLLTKDARLIMETPLFMPEVKKEQVELFITNAQELAKIHHCQPLKTTQAMKDPHIFFRFQGNNTPST